MKFSSKIYRRFIFSQDFFRFLLVDRVFIEKDNIVLITGARGSGKTSYSLRMITGFDNFRKIEEYYNKEANINKKEKILYKLENYTSFVMEEHMAFQRKELQELCRSIKRGFVLADEAIVNVARRNAMSKANKILHEILTINRKNFNTIFFCLPSVEDFDISILQYITIWVHIDSRGLGCVMLPNAKSIFGRKTWDIDKMKKTYDKFLEENPRATQVPYWLFDNFRGYIKFGKLPKSLEERYLDIAHEKKNRDTKEEESNKIKKPRLDDTKSKLLNEIADNLISGKIKDSADYYKYCGDLEFKKDRLNKEIAEILAKKGDGRTANKVIKENNDKYKAKKELIGSNRFKL